MPVFEYQATDASGMVISAEITAKDALAAADALRSRGLTVSNISQKKLASQPAAGAFFETLIKKHINSNIDEPIGRPAERSTTCGWCETTIPPPVTVTNCPNCGGNLPLPPGADRGPAPPPAPRHIPRKFEYKLKFGIMFWFGLLFLVMGLSMALFTLGFSLLFALAGGFILRSSWNTATGRIAALKFGQAGEGEITYVGYDQTTTVNGRHPFLVKYRWEVNGRYRDGQKTTWNDAAMDHFRGEPLWVVYMPDNTSQSAIWPPLA